MHNLFKVIMLPNLTIVNEFWNNLNINIYYFKDVWTILTISIIINIKMNKSKRIEREEKTLITMINMYCIENHAAAGLCNDCRELRDYALKRLESCPFGERKTTCAKCTVHCYKPQMRERIRKVMRFAGPRMIYKHPVQAVCHLIDGRRKMPR